MRWYVLCFASGVCKYHHSSPLVTHWGKAIWDQLPRPCLKPSVKSAKTIKLGQKDSKVAKAHDFIWFHASSTAQDGGGSFKNRKPIGAVGCCESRLAERIHWWTESWLECRIIHLSIYLSIHPSILVFCLLIYLPVNLSISLSSVFPSICLALYLSMQPSIHHPISVYVSNCLSFSLLLSFEICPFPCLSICLPSCGLSIYLAPYSYPFYSFV